VPRSERAHGGAQATPATPATSASCAAHVRSHRRNQRATTRKPQPESCRQRTAARKPRLHVVRLAQTFNRMQLIVKAQGTIGALVATREVGVAMRRRVWHVHAPTRSRNRGGQWLLLLQPNEAGDGTAGESSQAKPGTEFERLESARHDHSRGRGPSTTSRGQQPRPSPESHFHGRSHGQRGDLGATTRGPRPRATAAAHDHDGTTTDLTAAAVGRPLQLSDDSRISSVELGCLSCIPGRERRRNAFAPRPDQHHATRGVRGNHDDARPSGAPALPRRLPGRWGPGHALRGTATPRTPFSFPRPTACGVCGAVVVSGLAGGKVRARASRKRARVGPRTRTPARVGLPVARHGPARARHRACFWACGGAPRGLGQSVHWARPALARAHATRRRRVRVSGVGARR